MLQDIRNNFQGTMAKVIIVIICIPFVLFGVESIFSSGSSNKVAEVNGEAVTAQELNEAIYLRKRQLISQMGDNVDPEMLDDNRLMQPALESLVQRKLVLQAAENNGFAVSDVQLNQALRNTPEFQVDGKFSQERFHSLLNASGLSSSIFKRLYSSDMLVTQYSNGFINSGFVTDAEVDLNARFTHETRDIRYIQLTIEQAKKAISVTDEDIKAYYDENPDAFQSEAYVDAEYIELKLENFKQAVSDEAIKAAYEQELANLDTASSKIVSHILIEIDDDTSETQALARLNEVQQKLASGESFADLAQSYSEDLGSKEIGGLLGQLDEDAFPAAFVEAANTLSEGEVSEVIETDAGLHLIELTTVSKAEAPSFASRKDALAEELSLAEAEPKFWEAVETLKDVSFNAADLAEPAASVNVDVQTQMGVKRSSVDGLFANPDVISQLFSSSLTQEGMNSEVIELDASHVVVVRAKHFEPEKLMAFADVKDDAQALLVEQLASEKLVNDAEQYLTELKAGNDLESLAKANKLDWQLELAAKRTSTKTPREVITAAFKLPAAGSNQQAVAQTQLASGDVVIMSVNNVQQGKSESIQSFERQALKGFLARARAASALQSVQEQFKAESDIDYYR
jgi:peptidyl-prolyl cis-trans isomerase D